MATIYKRAGKDGKGAWCVRYLDPVTGKDTRKATKAKTKREAEIILANIVRDIDNGKYETAQRQREVTFFEICDNFKTYGQAHKRSWQRDNDSIKHLKEFLGNCIAMDIRPALIEDYIIHRKKSKTNRGNPPAPATINRELACLRTIFSRAIRNGKLEKNPVSFVKLLKENNKRDKVLTKEEFQKLLDASPEHLKPILITAYETGMRAGEIFNLTWEQVDMKNGFIILRPEQTKTNEGRKIPISPTLQKTLMQIRKKTGIVFQYNGQSIQSVKRSFHKACKKAGIKDFRFHDFRHTFVTNMRKAGKQDRVIMAITGHKTLSMLTRYDTVDESDLKTAVA